MCSARSSCSRLILQTRALPDHLSRSTRQTRSGEPMAPSVLPQYASLPGESSVALPLARLSTEREPRSKSGASASTLDVPGRSDDSPEEETEYEDRDGRDPRRGLLSGKDKADLDREDEDDELDEELVRAEAGHKPSRRPLSVRGPFRRAC